MTDPYTIQIFVLDGNPQGARIVTSLNWSGVCTAFPRDSINKVLDRPEFSNSGIYMLKGYKGDDDLPTVYIGQGEVIKNRLAAHEKDESKDFWDWGYVFTHNENKLNRAYSLWLEAKLCEKANEAGACILENKNNPALPSLSESERADANRFLSEMLQILPLLDLNVFEVLDSVASPHQTSLDSKSASQVSGGEKDTVVVPAVKGGFNRVFLGENRWYAIRISRKMRDKIKYIAAYQSAPISAITHYAPVKEIKPYGDQGKFQLLFSDPASRLPKSVPFGGATTGSMQGVRYTSLSKLLDSDTVVDLFE